MSRTLGRRVGRLADAAAVVDQRFLKALVDGPQRIVVAEVPLAEDAGAVAGRGQHLRQGHFLGIH